MGSKMKRYTCDKIGTFWQIFDEYEKASVKLSKGFSCLGSMIIYLIIKTSYRSLYSRLRGLEEILK